MCQGWLLPTPQLLPKPAAPMLRCMLATRGPQLPAHQLPASTSNRRHTHILCSCLLPVRCQPHPGTAAPTLAVCLAVDKPGQDIRGAPALQCPTVIVCWAAAQVQRGIRGTAAAQGLPAGKVHLQADAKARPVTWVLPTSALLLACTAVQPSTVWVQRCSAWEHRGRLQTTYVPPCL